MTLISLSINIPVCMYDCTIHFAHIHPLIIILFLITIGFCRKWFCLVWPWVTALGIWFNSNINNHASFFNNGILNIWTSILCHFDWKLKALILIRRTLSLGASNFCLGQVVRNNVVYSTLTSIIISLSSIMVFWTFDHQYYVILIEYSKP
jgi:hypothetical protein